MIQNQSIIDRRSFAVAKQLVEESGLDARYSDSILHVDDVTESLFLRELAWVILSSGFKEKVVRKIFPHISLCFCDWETAEEISRNRNVCESTALDVFKSKNKIKAIADGASLINDLGFLEIKNRMSVDVLSTLRMFPFIGPITVFHLAKNIGYDVSKPDRHIVRLGNKHGYDDANEFCLAVSRMTELSVSFVDTIMWRLSEMGLSDDLFMPSISRA